MARPVTGQPKRGGQSLEMHGVRLAIEPDRASLSLQLAATTGGDPEVITAVCGVRRTRFGSFSSARHAQRLPWALLIDRSWAGYVCPSNQISEIH